MDNKGFTLIELLVTILLLSIISVISYVSVINVIKESNKKDCQALVNNIKIATKEYVSDNRYKTSFISGVVGDEITITATDLINNNYLRGPIKNPFNKTNINSNSVRITVTLDDDYTANTIAVSGINCD